MTRPDRRIGRFLDGLIHMPAVVLFVFKKTVWFSPLILFFSFGVKLMETIGDERANHALHYNTTSVIYYAYCIYYIRGLESSYIYFPGPKKLRQTVPVSEARKYLFNS